MPQIDENFFDRLVVTEAEALRALEELKARIGDPLNMAMLRDLALVGRYTLSQGVRTMTLGGAMVNLIALNGLLETVQDRLVQVSKEKQTKANQNKVLKLARVIADLAGQFTKAQRIMLEAGVK